MAKASPAAKLGQARSKGGVSRSLGLSRIQSSKERKATRGHDTAKMTAARQSTRDLCFRKVESGYGPQSRGLGNGYERPSLRMIAWRQNGEHGEGVRAREGEEDDG
jgi:hypothetical protein